MGDKRPGKGPKKGNSKDKKTTVEFSKELSPQSVTSNKTNK